MKNFEKGITLVELVVVVVIIAVFSSILISDFPQIKRQYALSRATYKLAQNLRKVQDMGLSGVKITNDAGQAITVKEGYGLYVNIGTQPARQYLLYGNSCEPADYKYTYGGSCNDFLIDTINADEDQAGVYIKEIDYINGTAVSINFNPPNPYINIVDNLGNSYTSISIVLALSSNPSITRAVAINTAGLIEVK
jgi:prepilin-type N-terminal cleavage/methylation domain-containing protein